MESIKTFEKSISISENEDEVISQIGNLISETCLGWDKDEISVKLLSGGMLNKVYIITKNTEDSNKEVMNIRIFTDKTSSIANTKDQLLCMQAAYEAGLGAKLIAAFTNGIIYEYLPGAVLNPSVYDDEIIRKLVAIKLGKLHEIVSPSEELSREPRLLRNFDQFLADIPEELGKGDFYINDSPYLASKQSMVEELLWLKGLMESAKLEVVFNHGDLWWGNILYDKKNEKINFIDYDLSGYDFPQIDLSRFLDSARFKLNPVKWDKVSVEEEKEFLKTYLETRASVKNPSGAVSDEQVQQLYGQVVLAKPFMNLTFMTFTLKLHQLCPEMNIISFLKGGGAMQYEGAKQELLQYLKSHTI